MTSSSRPRILPFALGLDIRTFVFAIVVIIIVGNSLFLLHLSPTSGGISELRPNGPPVEPRQYQQPSLIKSKHDKILATLKKTNTKPTTTPSKPAPEPTTPPVVSNGGSLSAPHAERVSIWRRPATSKCDLQFGNGFSMKTQLCRENSVNNYSSMDCDRNPSTKGVTCAGRNILLDVSKLHVAHGGEPIESVRGRSEDSEFIRYARGAFQMSCQSAGVRTNAEQFPHHLRNMVDSIDYITPIQQTDVESGFSAQCDQWIEEPTLMVTRYEYANLYHSMGDFYNTYQTQWMNGLTDEKNLKVIFMDGHSAGALDEVWPIMFGSENVHYVKSLPELYAGNGGASKNKFCFRRLYLVSPAYKCALSVEMMVSEPGACAAHPCLRDFSRGFLDKYQIESMDPWRVFSPSDTDLFGQPFFPSTLDLTRTPLVTMIFRRDYLAHPRLQDMRASRKISNEPLIAQVLQKVNRHAKSAHVLGVDFAKLTVVQQLLLIRYSSILVGIHGAGLSYTVFLQPGAQVLELMPPEYSGRPHFQYFAAWAGREYTVMAVGPEQGSTGHFVDGVRFETILNQLIDKARRIDTSGGAYLIQPTSGWKDAFAKGGPATTEAQSPLPSAPSTFRVPTLKPPTPPPSDSSSSQSDGLAMIALPLPSLPLLSTALDPSADRGLDLGASQNDDHRLCLIIPFRDSASPTSQGGNRTGNLMEMIPHMIRHLKNAGGMKFVRDFEIMVVEQTEKGLFNKGALFNVGYIHSKRSGCDYMVLHDVDQLPVSPQNRYRFPKGLPVHLCSASSQYGYATAYGTMVGGALLISMAQYESINGYSNYYWGWGQEDDDFFFRIASKFGTVERLDAQAGRYEALSHPRVKDLDVTPVFSKGSNHLANTRNGQLDLTTDGLSNLKYSLKAVQRWEKWPRGVRKFVAELEFDKIPIDLNGNTK